MRNAPGIITANLACFLAMFMWAFAFPASEELLFPLRQVSILSLPPDVHFVRTSIAQHGHLVESLITPNGFP